MLPPSKLNYIPLDDLTHINQSINITLFSNSICPSHFVMGSEKVSLKERRKVVKVLSDLTL